MNVTPSVDDGTGMNWYSARTAGGNTGPILFYDNTLTGFSKWDTGSSSDATTGWHPLLGLAWDGLARRAAGFTSTTTDRGGDEAGSPGGNDLTADVFLEGGSGSGADGLCRQHLADLRLQQRLHGNHRWGTARMEVASGRAARLQQHDHGGRERQPGTVPDTTNSEARPTTMVERDEASTGCNILVYYSHLPTFQPANPTTTYTPTAAANVCVRLKPILAEPNSQTTSRA